MKQYIAFFVAILLTGCAGTPVKSVPKLKSTALTTAEVRQSVRLTRVISRIPLNRAFYEARYGMLCELAGRRNVPSETVTILPESLQIGFRGTLEPLGFKIAKDSETAFGNAEIGDLQIGATIVDFQSTLCHGMSGHSSLSAGAPNMVKGKMYFDILWEVYSSAEDKVIYAKSVPASFEVDSLISSRVTGMMLGTFLESLKNFSTDTRLRQLIQQDVPSKRQSQPTA
jgi:hypothetical protein